MSKPSLKKRKSGAGQPTSDTDAIAGCGCLVIVGIVGGLVMLGSCDDVPAEPDKKKATVSAPARGTTRMPDLRRVNSYAAIRDLQGRGLKVNVTWKGAYRDDRVIGAFAEDEKLSSRFTVCFQSVEAGAVVRSPLEVTLYLGDQVSAQLTGKPICPKAKGELLGPAKPSPKPPVKPQPKPSPEDDGDWSAPDVPDVPDWGSGSTGGGARDPYERDEVPGRKGGCPPGGCYNPCPPGGCR
ncbi:hypothetical protein [Streptomyces noursei]